MAYFVDVSKTFPRHHYSFQWAQEEMVMLTGMEPWPRLTKDDLCIADPKCPTGQQKNITLSLRFVTSFWGNQAVIWWQVDYTGPHPFWKRQHFILLEMTLCMWICLLGLQCFWETHHTWVYRMSYSLPCYSTLHCFCQRNSFYRKWAVLMACTGLTVVALTLEKKVVKCHFEIQSNIWC